MNTMAIRSFLAVRIQTGRNRHKDVSGGDERADLMEQLVERRSEGIMSSNIPEHRRDLPTAPWCEFAV
jgi:hypothetical protein